MRAQLNQLPGLRIIRRGQHHIPARGKKVTDEQSSGTGQGIAAVGDKDNYWFIRHKFTTKG